MDRHATLAMTIEVSPRPPSRGPGILSMAHRATALLLPRSRVKPGMTKGPIPACAGMTERVRITIRRNDNCTFPLSLRGSETTAAIHKNYPVTS